MYSDRKQINGWNWDRVGIEERKRQGSQRGTKKFFEVMDMFIILIMMMTSWAYTYVKTHQIEL